MHRMDTYTHRHSPSLLPQQYNFHQQQLSQNSSHQHTNNLTSSSQSTTPNHQSCPSTKTTQQPNKASSRRNTPDFFDLELFKRTFFTFFFFHHIHTVKSSIFTVFPFLSKCLPQRDIHHFLLLPPHHSHFTCQSLLADGLQTLMFVTPRSSP